MQLLSAWMTFFGRFLCQTTLFTVSLRTPGNVPSQLFSSKQSTTPSVPRSHTNTHTFNRPLIFLPLTYNFKLYSSLMVHKRLIQFERRVKNIPFPQVCYMQRIPFPTQTNSKTQACTYTQTDRFRAHPMSGLCQRPHPVSAVIAEGELGSGRH